MRGHPFCSCEAKAEFGEIIRQVRAGKSVTISYRGREVAEIRPVTPSPSLEASISRLEEEGLIIRIVSLDAKQTEVAQLLGFSH
ncbi:MAG: type II toxin-antitoxin system prevent-host-death family antitoxin [Acidobacteria bacterium]|nr:MAG: type II toxin-antitoxin system prevent-host-death family antitoxin [Acidobacteriota bacterium]